MICDVMCGVFCSIACKNCINVKPTDDILTKLHHRGPDSVCNRTLRIVSHENSSVRPELCATELCLFFCSTVLALRGDFVVSQPLHDEKSNSRLCWNGEAWIIGDQPVCGNDSKSVFELLLLAAADDTVLENPLTDQSNEDRVISALMSIKGPFAFVFHDYPRSRIFFGRDCLGRRSLLFKSQENYFAISSVSDGTSGWKEVEADGIYMLNLSHSSEHDANSSTFRNVQLHGFNSNLRRYPYDSFDKYSDLNRSVTRGFSSLTRDSSVIQTIQDYLQLSLKLRVLNIFVPPQHRAENGRDTRELSKALIATDGPDLNPSDVPTRVNSSNTSDCIPKVAVLFSGGLDCTLIARMLHDILPKDDEIDLLNVAFQNPRLKDGENAYERCPDRITGRAAHAELRTVCSGRFWRLVEINVPYDEAMNHRSTIVSLIHPHNTEMDLSIAFALYFASRGLGVCSGRTYETPARVLLSGLGADELFGGYQRHATAFNRQGFEGLLDELQLDISRLGKRNLGRDDRVVSHWGKEARYPYLDETFVKLVVELPIFHKTGFGQEDQNVSGGERVVEPAKMALRLLALKLGMHNVAHEKKRAIQFGARTAKLEGRTKGTQLIIRD